MRKLHRHLVFSLLAAGALASCGGEKKDAGASSIETFDRLEAEFPNPSKDYRPVPFFVWNADTKKSDIDFALNQLKEQGMGGGFVHPRMGMITEYLSDDWFDLWKYTVEKGKELGLDTWIYDENGFPSGMAGGLVEDQMPESYNQGHSLGMIVQGVLKLDPKEEYTVILKEEDGKYTDITATAAAEVGKSGKYYLFNKLFMEPSPRYGGFPYVNLLMPGVTEKFIEITMPGYEKHVGSEFGKAIPGIFTDEPHIRPATGATWFTDLFEKFEQRWGYRLQENLPSLFTEVGDWRKIRHNYRMLLMETKVERWSKPWREYCDSTGLKWTGHYWEHAWPNPHVTPDNMLMYTFHHVPAIDNLFNQYNEASPSANFGNVRAVREVRSIANQMGTDRTLCEIYAGSGWELSFFDLKRQADWINVLGITTLTQHYVPLSIKGIRKTDYPQVFSYHGPWWPYYRVLNDYHARIAAALSSGLQVNDLLVIEPTTSAWMYYIRGFNKVGYKIGQIARPFQEFVTDLETNQVEYDLGSENVMKEYASVPDGKPELVLGERTYRTLVIPSSMENVNASTMELLKKYTDAGGKVLVFGNGPVYLEGMEDEGVKAFFADSRKVTRMDSLDGNVLDAHFRNDKIRFADDVADKGRIYHQRREMKDGQILFLTNTDDSVRVAGEVTIAGTDALKLDPMTGTITDYPETAVDGGKITVKCDLYPADNLLLFVADRKRSGYEPTPVYADMKPVAAVSEVTAKREGDNVLVVDYCDLDIEGKQLKGVNTYVADNEVYRTYGFKGGNPWYFSSQFKTEFLDHKFPENSKFTTTYRFDVADGVDASSMKAVVERAADWQIAVNGHPVSPEAGQWWVDMDFGVVKIGEYVKPGANTLTLTVSPVTVHSETMPVYILGDFSVQANRNGWTIDKPESLATGSWKAQGMPFYSHAVTYAKDFDVPAGGQHYEVELDDWNGTVAEVLVNGQSAGIIGWPPYRADVSDFVKEGKNTVEVKVIGSHKNLFGSFYAKARGQVSPALMKRAPEKQPAPTEYDLFDYGLNGDIVLLGQ